MPLIDTNDIQAEENRRREVAVKAGASPRATKYEDSELKRMIQKAVEEQIPAVADEFAEYKKNVPLPGYNFVSTANSFKPAEDVIADAKAAAKEMQKEANLQSRLQKEAAENEMKITRTSTGQPKVENGEEQQTLQPAIDSEKAVLDVKPTNTPKTGSTTNPSPVGSGDPKAAAAPKDNS